jgi:predicted MPP superfamily phosphohydrolase
MMVVFWLLGVLVPLSALGAALRPGPRGARVGLGLFGLVALGVSVDATFVEPRRVTAPRREIAVAGAPRTPLRIAHVSDVQTDYLGHRELEALRHVQGFDPDLVVLTGDYANGGVAHRESAAGARWFAERLRARLGVFAVTGDEGTPEDDTAIFAGTPVRLLRNESVRLETADGPLWVAGTDRMDPDQGRALRGIAHEEFCILIQHRPERVRNLPGWGVDLFLCGHTHGGQVAIPGFGPLTTLCDLGRRYDRGVFEWQGVPFHICAGLGMEGRFAPRVRFWCPPEVALLTVRRAGTAAARPE